MRAALAGLMAVAAVTGARADDKDKLYGSWKLLSWVVEVVDTKEQKPLYGEHPQGYLILLPSGRMAAVLTGEGRKPPQNDADRAAAFKTMAAYSGTYTVEGNKWITKVDVAWNEGFKRADQTRFFRIEGDKLYIESPPAPNFNYDNKLTRNILVWKREK